MDTVPERPTDDALMSFRLDLCRRVLGPDFPSVVRHMTVPEMQALMWVGLHGGTRTETDQRALAALQAAITRIVSEHGTESAEAER